ncbi:hypothetical protein D3C87_1711970 [compost metagenome]
MAGGRLVISTILAALQLLPADWKPVGQVLPSPTVPPFLSLNRATMLSTYFSGL